MNKKKVWICWLTLVALCVTSSADVVTRRWGAPAAPKAAAGKGKKDGGEQQAQAGKGLQVMTCKGGQCVLRFDLSDLPKGAKIVRADLLIGRTADPDGKMDEAMVDTEIYPQFFEFKDGDEGKTSRTPLAIRGPWFDAVDATEAVDKWAGGKANGGFFVKSCAFLNAGGTCLDVVYEGKPEGGPAQAAGLKVFHRAGQTFITWKETSDLVGKDEISWKDLRQILNRADGQGETRYCIYRHKKPITAASLDDAELIARVKPLSGWNINARNLDQGMDIFMGQYYLNHGKWNPFWGGEQDGTFGNDCRMGRFVIEDGAKPLPGGTGLYVHTPAEKGKACYAVVTALNGVQNTADFSKENSLSGAVEEIPAEPQPVLQGELPARPYWNYEETRNHYVQWVAPPYGNLPCQYYNWSVGVPTETEKNPPIELSLHRDGYSFYRTQYRLEPGSIVLSPYDFPVVSAWYGYHESEGTLKSFKQGVIHNYTERRILSFVSWAARKWQADANRIVVTGYGGPFCTSGVLHLGVRHPEVFSMVVTGYAIPDYKKAIEVDGDGDKKHIPDVEKIWGKLAWDIKTDTGKSVWDEQNLSRIVRELPATTDLPLVTVSGRYFLQAERDFFLAMMEKKQPLMTSFNTWGGRYVAVSRDGSWAAVQLDIRRNLCLPAFSGDEKGLAQEAKKYEVPLNLDFRWNPNNDTVDEAGKVEITLSRQGRGGGPVSVTLRRLQKFKVEKGKSYSWDFKVAVPDRKTGPQKGEATVGEDGLLTIPDLNISGAGGRLIVTSK